MRQAVTMFLLFAVAGSFASVPADPASDFFAEARSAIGAPATLATVHSLYMAVTIRRINPGSSMPSLEGSMGRAAQSSLIATWMAPPSRYLRRSGAYAWGFDGDRLIGITLPNGIDLRDALRKMALTLLLYDPKALDVAVTDLGVSVVGKKRLHVLDATADGFEMRLSFDPNSHRLVMTEDSSVRTSFSLPLAPPNSGAMRQAPGVPIPGPTRRIVARNAYGSYRRVDGIELPFSIARTTPGLTGGPVTNVLEVVKYVINPRDFDQQFRQ